MRMTWQPNGSTTHPKRIGGKMTYSIRRYTECSHCGGKMHLESDIHGTYWGCMCGKQIDIKPSYSYTREVYATLPIGLMRKVDTFDNLKDICYD